MGVHINRKKVRLLARPPQRTFAQCATDGRGREYIPFHIAVVDKKWPNIMNMIVIGHVQVVYQVNIISKCIPSWWKTGFIFSQTG